MEISQSGKTGMTRVKVSFDSNAKVEETKVEAAERNEKKERQQAEERRLETEMNGAKDKSSLSVGMKSFPCQLQCHSRNLSNIIIRL